jgi:hypothetical protein
MAEFTPGSWSIQELPREDWDEPAFRIEGNGPTLLLEVVACPYLWVPGQNEANAHLIAASPDLLESHEPERAGPDFLDWIANRLVEVHGESPNVDFVIALRRRAAKARAAIAKAEGRTNG